jgi:hypothetical protein
MAKSIDRNMDFGVLLAFGTIIRCMCTAFGRRLQRATIENSGRRLRAAGYPLKAGQAVVDRVL